MVAKSVKLVASFLNSSALTRPLMVLGAVSAAWGGASAQSVNPNTLPQGANVVGGNATVQQAGNALNINQSSKRTVIDWRSFDIGSSAQVNFNQPGTSSIAVNRVNNSANPTQIQGGLHANGQVWILNPNGVYFGSTARVDAAGIVATTANIDVNQFMAGSNRLQMKGADHGSVTNAGSITVGESGLAAFVAPSVRNSGTINAKVGKVTLAAGTTYTLDLAGDRLVEIGLGSGNAVVDQSGKIVNPGGTVALTAKAASQVVNSVVNVSGVVDASSVKQVGGNIVLGGDDITTTSSAVLAANGGSEGSGGAITAVADHQGTYAGTFSAKGGATSGDGGKIETSGKTVSLAKDIKVDTSAPHGATGAWSIDPADLVVGDSEAAAFASNLATNNTSITASSSITVNSAIDSSAQTNSNTLTFADEDANGLLTVNLNAAIKLGINQHLTGQANLVNVVNGANIQNGIDVALAGATVNVGAGHYAPNVTINKSGLSLLGSAGAEIDVDPGTGAVNAINIAGSTNGVTVSGFTLRGEITGSYIDYPFVNNTTGGIISRGIFVNNSATNFTISGNDIRNLRTGIVIDGRNTGTVTNNTIDNTKSAISVQYTDGTGFDKSLPNSSDIKINIFDNRQGDRGNEWGINYHLNGHWDGIAGTTSPVHNYVVAGETGSGLLGVAPTVAQQQALLDASAANDGWSVQDQAYSSSNRTSVYVGTSSAGVAGSDANQGSPRGTLATIGAGINAVVSGGTVHLASGNYLASGQGVMSKSLSIVGDAASRPVITTDTDFSGTGTAGAWILVNSGVTFGLSNVILDGSGHSVYQALRSQGNTTVDNVAFRNITVSGQPYYGVAIESFGGTVAGGAGSDTNGAGGSASHLTVTNSTFENIGRIGVLVKGTASTADITGNTFTGKGVGDFLDYGIEVGASGQATITGNTISGNNGVATVDGSTSAGILVTSYYGGASHATITNNVITGNTSAVALGYDGSDISVVHASNNDFSGNDHGVTLTSTLATADFSGNWWGTTDKATLLAYMNGAAAALVDVSPILMSGVDTDSTTFGFQGDFSNLIVTALGGGSASGRIQEGVDLVDAGGTVNVDAGTYQGQVVIDKSLTLAGAGIGNSIISSPDTLAHSFTASGTARKAVVSIENGANVSLSGFTVDGRGQGAVNNSFIGVGFYNAGGTVDGVRITRVREGGESGTLNGNQHGVGLAVFNADGASRAVTFKNSLIDDFQKTAVLFRGAGLTANADQNTITGAGATAVTAQNGIQVDNAAVANIKNNTIGGITYTGAGWASSDIIVTQSNDTLIEGNTITGVGVSKLSVGIYATGTNNNLTIKNNTFTSFGYAVVVSPGDNTRISGGSFADNIYAIYADSTATNLGITGVNFSNNEVQFAGPSSSVADVFANNTFDKSVYVSGGDAIYSKIQDGVDTASAGSTVNVGVGTYAEALNIAKNVDIIGAGVGQTIIRPTTLLSTGVGHKYDANVQATVFVHDADNVNLRGLTIDGNNLGNNAVVFWNNASGSIRESMIQNPMVYSGAQTGQGLAVDATSGHTTNLTVADVMFRNWNKNAIDVVTGDGASTGGGNVNLTVQRSTFSGRGLTGTIAQNGIVLWEKAGGTVNATIDGSRFTDIFYTDPAAATAAGVLVYGSPRGTTTVSNSSFTDIQEYISTAGGAVHEVNATQGNTFDGVAASSATLDQLFAIEDHLVDGTDAAGNGLVRLVAGQVYVTAAKRSIQNGVTAASSGDTVNVQAGTYNGFGTSFGGPANVTIQTSQGAIIDASAVPTTPITRVVDLRADGTMFKGFTIKGNGNDVGISISGRSVTASGNTINAVLTGVQTTTQYPANNATITGNAITAGYGISLQSAGATVSGNTVTASAEGVGLKLAANTTFSNNSITTGASGRAVNFVDAMSSGGLTASGNTVNVAGGDLQGAAYLAGTNGALNLAAGSYAIGSTLNISKNGLTLKGAGEGTTTITSTASGYGVNVTANDVTLSSFSLNGNPSGSYSIKVSPGGAASSRLLDFAIDHVTVNGSKRTGLDLNGVKGATIDHVTVTNSTSGNGITLTDSADVTVSNSHTSGNAWGGLALYQDNNYYDQQETNITVDASNTFIEVNSVYLQDSSNGTTKFGGATGLDFGTLNIAGYSFAVFNPNGRGKLNDGAQFTWLQKSQQSAIDFAMGTFGMTNTSSSFVKGWTGGSTDNIYTVGVSTGGQAMSINAAANASAAGATINVLDGTYAEDVAVGSARILNLGSVTVDSLTLDAGAAGTQIAGKLAGGTIALNGAVTLTGDLTLDTSASNGSIAVAAVDGTTAGAQALTLKSGTGSVSLGDVGATTRLAAVSDANATTLTGSTYAAGSLGFGALTLAKDAVLQADTIAVASVGGTAAGAQALTLNGGAVSLGDVGATTRLGTVSDASATTLTGSTYAADSFDFGALILTNDTAFDAGSVAIASVDGTTAGAQALTLKAATASLGDLGATTKLGAVSDSAKTTLTGSAYTASSLDLGALTLTSDTVLDAGTITVASVDGTVAGAQALMVKAGAVSLGDVGAATQLGAVSDGNTTTLTGSTYAADSFDFGALTLAKDTVINAGKIGVASVDGTTAGGQALTLKAGTVSLGNLGATTRLGAVSDTSTTTLTGTTYAANGLGFGALTLAKDATLDTSANNGTIVVASVNGTTAGAQALALKAGTGTVSLGNVGATTRLGAVSDASATTLTGSTYTAKSFALAGAVTLTSGATTLDTAGGNIVFTGDIFGTANGGQSLVLNAGSGLGLTAAANGNITMQNAGTKTVRLNNLTVNGNSFTALTVALAGNFVSHLTGNQVFAADTLDTLGSVNSTVAGNASGHIVAGGAVTLGVTGGLSGTISGGDIALTTGTISNSTITGTGNLTVASQSVTGATFGGTNVTVNANSFTGAVSGSNVNLTTTSLSNANITSTGNLVVASQSVAGSTLNGSNVTVSANSFDGTVTASGNANIQAATIGGTFTAGTVTLAATDTVNATITADTLNMSASKGDVTGTWTTVNTTGAGTIVVNGESNLGNSGANPNQLVVEGFALPLGTQVRPSGEIVLPQGMVLGLLSPGGASKPRVIVVHDVRRLGELLEAGYVAIVMDLSGREKDKDTQLALN